MAAGMIFKGRSDALRRTCGVAAATPPGGDRLRFGIPLAEATIAGGQQMATHDWLVRIHADKWICTVKKAATGDAYTATVGQSGDFRWTGDYSTIQQATQAADAELVELGHHCSAGCVGWANASHDE